jgi:hypothetical protein
MRTFRVRYQKLGGHFHTRVFSAENPRGTFAKLGELTFDEKDWASFLAQLGTGWEFIDEAEPDRVYVRTGPFLSVRPADHDRR